MLVCGKHMEARWDHGSIEADIVQEELRVLYLHLNTARRRLVPT